MQQEQEIIALTASNHSLANEVSSYMHDASQRNEVEWTYVFAIDKLEFNVKKLNAANKQQEQKFRSLLQVKIPY